MIGSEIPVQLVMFLSKLFQLCIHTEDLSFVDRLDGDGLCLGVFGTLQKASKQGPDT